MENKMTNEELINRMRNVPCWAIGTETEDTMIAAADELESISKTVIPHRNYENLNMYWCDCGWFLRNKDETPNYCPNCGKRIEWENAE